MEAADADDEPDVLRNTRQQMDQLINKLNKLLFVYFKNDKRIHFPVMHLISLMNYGISLIDNDYRNAVMKKESDEELGNIRGAMESNAYQISTEETNMPGTRS